MYSQMNILVILYVRVSLDLPTRLDDMVDLLQLLTSPLPSKPTTLFTCPFLSRFKAYLAPHCT